MNQNSDPLNLSMIINELQRVGWVVFNWTECDVMGEEKAKQLWWMLSRALAPYSNIKETKMGNRSIFPIKYREMKKSFSSTTGPSKLHTDSQYLKHPEKYMFLLCENPAASGGETIFLEYKSILDSLKDVNFSEYQLLFQKNWRWKVPKDLQTDVGYKLSPLSEILSKNCQVRWKSNNIICTPKARLIAEKFEQVIEQSNRVKKLALKRGDIFLCDNSRVLHGRSTFIDKERLYYRGRI